MENTRPKPPVRKLADFTEVGPRQKYNRLADINGILDAFVEKNNVTINQLIGYALYSRNFNTNKYLVKIGDELYTTDNVQEPAVEKLDLDRTIALKTQINLSRNDMTFVKVFFQDTVRIPGKTVFTSIQDPCFQI